MNVAAVIVTRGDVDLSSMLDSLPRDWDKMIWDNSQREDLGVYGRYAGISETVDPLIFLQDDDCILAPEAFDMLLAAYQPGHVVANMPQRFRPHYPDSCLVGFGALFDRDLPTRAFERFRSQNGEPIYTADGAVMALPTFHRTCDVVFTTLTPRILVDAPVEIFDYAHDDSRMWKQPTHYGERQEMLRLARQVRDSVPA